MAWVLLDDNFPNHPKAVQAGPVAAYLFVCGLCYCRRYHTDGFIPTRAIKSLGVASKPTRMIAALVEVGLWDVVDGGYQVHGYEEFYADSIDKALKEARRENGRKGGIESRRLNNFASKPGGDGEVPGSSVLLLKKEERLERFEAFWECYPRKDGKQAARTEWLRLDPDDTTQQAIASDLERRCRSAQWTKDNGQFVPHARTYLHQRRWEDGFTEPPPRPVGDAASLVFQTLGVKP